MLSAQSGAVHAPGDRFSCFCLQKLRISFVDRVDDRGSLAFLADLQNVGCEAEAPVDECICVHAALPLSDFPPPHTLFGAGWLSAIPVTPLFYRFYRRCQANKRAQMRHFPAGFLARFWHVPALFPPMRLALCGQIGYNERCAGFC